MQFVASVSEPYLNEERQIVWRQFKVPFVIRANDRDMAVQMLRGTLATPSEEIQAKLKSQLGWKEGERYDVHIAELPSDYTIVSIFGHIAGSKALNVRV